MKCHFARIMSSMVQMHWLGQGKEKTLNPFFSFRPFFHFSQPQNPLQILFFGRRPLPFGGSPLEAYSRTSGESNHHRQSVSVVKNDALPTEPRGHLTVIKLNNSSNCIQRRIELQVDSDSYAASYTTKQYRNYLCLMQTPSHSPVSPLKAQ